MTIRMQQKDYEGEDEFFIADNDEGDEVSVCVMSDGKDGVSILTYRSSEDDYTSCTLSKEDAIAIAQYILDKCGCI